MAEALWGEEQALQQLGRPSEERAVLEELLQNYPRSAYVAAAEKRLAALNN
jgi:outer membrane protein assembly factor BamD (BamD/ComL family)